MVKYIKTNNKLHQCVNLESNWYVACKNIIVFIVINCIIVFIYLDWGLFMDYILSVCIFFNKFVFDKQEGTILKCNDNTNLACLFLRTHDKI